MSTVDTKELILEFKAMARKTDLVKGSQKLGLGSTWWDGRVQGIKDCIECLVQKDQPKQEPVIMKMTGGSK